MATNNRTNYRNSWKLCKQHCNCPKCKKAIKCWTDKANKHAYTAAALKYVLMCVLDERSNTIPVGDLEVLQNLQTTRPKEGELNNKCGICMEKYSVGGENNMVAFGCGHTICLKCCGQLQQTTCPYCRKDITKAIVLYYDKVEE